MEGFHRKKKKNLTSNSWNNYVLHASRTSLLFHNVEKLQKAEETCWEVSLSKQYNSHALGFFYFEMNLADRKMPLLYKQKAISEDLKPRQQKNTCKIDILEFKKKKPKLQAHN